MKPGVNIPFGRRRPRTGKRARQRAKPPSRPPRERFGLDVVDTTFETTSSISNGFVT